MTKHLPECAVSVARPGTFTSCICDELRECEERSQRDMLVRCIAAVKRLEPDLDRHGCLQDALAVLRALQEKP